MKKRLAVFIVYAMLASMLAACSDANDNSNANINTSESFDKQHIGEHPTHSTEKVKISAFISGGSTFPEGQSINENPWIDLIEQTLNVDLHIEYGPADAGEYMNKLTLKFASNDIPDFFVIPIGYQNWLMQNAEMGALKSLDHKIDDYPQLKKAVVNEAWEAVTYNGQIYGIPVLNDGNLGTNNFYVRRDWLDKLNLNVPTTLEEFEAVAKAFRDQDPDGNGRDDTYGYIAYDNILSWSGFFGAYGVIPGYWIEREGKLVPADIQPEMKEALAYIQHLYAEQLLDNEWPIKKVKAYHEKVENNQVGIYEGNWAATRNEINTSKQNDPTAIWQVIAPPIGPTEKQGVLGGDKYKTVVAMSSQATNTDKILHVLQWMTDENNRDKFVFGFDELGEGFMYSIVDEQYALNFKNHNKYGYRQQLLFMQPKELNKKKMEALGAEFDLVRMIEHSVSHSISNAFTGAPTPAMVENNSSLEQLRTEIFTKIIVGELPIDAFDIFVQQYLEKGGSKIMEEVQSWYNETN